MPEQYLIDGERLSERRAKWAINRAARTLGGDLDNDASRAAHSFYCSLGWRGIAARPALCAEFLTVAREVTLHKG